MVVCYNFWGKDSNLKKCLADNNVLTEEYIEKIMQLFAGNEDKEQIAKSVDENTIAEEKCWNKKVVKNIDRLYSEIDGIIAGIEGQIWKKN